MPRPGPRPYECVRRAWHSDSHHPIRGSLIQEIFRIVNEVHSSATKKNKEWKENLPIVVLKAEEIMYSKANSEAEYSNLKTLWHRVNDAIDNIIRRDESSETGEFLLPCIEAALYLGCTPRISSRSQRNDTPRYYLRPETPDSTSVPPSNLDSKLLGNYTLKSELMLQYSKFLTTTINSSFSGTNVESQVVRNKDCSNMKLPVLPKNLIPSGNYQSEPIQTLWSVYPLYNADQLQFDDPKFSLKQPSNSYFHPTENDKTKSIQNHSSCKANPPKITLPVKSDSNNPSEIQCDLSLRLGSPTVSCKSMRNGCPQEEENINLGNARERRRKLSEDFSFFVQAKNKGVCWQLSLNSMKE